jgi:glycosyltransferase involved in cell wall biosynthesis
MTASTERWVDTAADVNANARRRERELRLAVIGMSTSATCGVRDHATLLATGLQGEHVHSSMHWLSRRAGTFAQARAEVGAWAQELTAELRSERPDALLLHYSVFAHAYRGLPLFVAPMVKALRESRIPLIGLLHEYAFRRRGRSGLNGAAWSLSQRAALLGVMRASTAVIATMPQRADWLATRVWLPRRPLAVAPVFSTLPAPAVASSPAAAAAPADAAASPAAVASSPVAGLPADEGRAPRVGLFGYSCRPELVALVLDAVALARAHGLPFELTLLGAPGADSEVGELWRSEAAARALEQALRFSGTVAAQELSDMLAACELLLFVDRPGPTSRKTTLAGSLASGTAVLALDGPESWGELIEADAVALAAPRPDALAAAIERLLGAREERAALAARGRAFAAARMSVARSAAVVAAQLDYILDGARAGALVDSHASRAAP